MRSSAAAPAPSFALASTYAKKIGSISVAVGNLNGDNKPDLVIADLYDDTVSVFLNRGNGSFSARRDYGAADGPFDVALADLNGDGKLDVATATVEEGVVSVRLNKGNGSLQASRRYQADVGARSVAVGDLNGDRKPDLATASGATNNVSVLLNAGGGSFEPKHDYRTGEGPEQVAIGDVNGDGTLDLVTANEGTEEKPGATVSVLLNQGDASFAGRRDYGTGRAPSSVAIGDLNGDAKADLATADQLGDTVSVLLNAGDGSFAARRAYRTGRHPLSVAIGDLNGDRKPDLATADYLGRASGGYLGHTLSILTNRTGGNFQAKRDYLTGRGPASVAIGDLNRDGKPDLATANEEEGVSVLFNATGLCAVPDLKGKTVPNAKRAIRRGDCRVGTIHHVDSKRIKKGRVMTQKPRAGAVLPTGGRIDLVVSRGGH